MEKDCFAVLHGEDYNFKSIFVMKQYWKEGQRFVMSRPRPTDGMLLFVGAEGVCERRGEAPLRVPKGTLVYLGAGARYSWDFRDVEPGVPTAYLFEFLLTTPEGEPMTLGHEVRVLDIGHFELYEKHFLRLLEETARPQVCPGARRAGAYRLLNEVTRHAYRRDRQDVDTALIARGIEYLEEDPRQEKSIEQIAEMCGVSTNYFERLFRAYAGVAPAAFRLERRLERAEALLSGGTMTLSQIAEELGFGDSAYLCRIFRKKNGISPGEYRRLHKA